MNYCNTNNVRNVNYDLESTTMFESEHDQFIPTSTNKKSKFVTTPLALGLASLFGCAVLGLTIFGFVKCCEKSEEQKFREALEQAHQMNAENLKSNGFREALEQAHQANAEYLKGNGFPSLRAGAASLFGRSSMVAADTSADTNTYQQQPQVIYVQQPGTNAQYVNADGTVVNGVDEGYTAGEIVGMSFGYYFLSNILCTTAEGISLAVQSNGFYSGFSFQGFWTVCLGNVASCNIAALNFWVMSCCDSYIWKPTNQFLLCC